MASLVAGWHCSAVWGRQDLKFEAGSGFVASSEFPFGYVNYETRRAANALHAGDSNWLDLALIDADLQCVILAWRGLSGPIRRAVVVLVRSQECCLTPEPPTASPHQPEIVAVPEGNAFSVGTTFGQQRQPVQSVGILKGSEPAIVELAR